MTESCMFASLNAIFEHEHITW